MFGKKAVTAFVQDQVETMIGKDTVITGPIQAKGTVRVDGTVDGDVTTAGDLVVGDAGTIRAAAITARSGLISGTVYGNVEMQDKLELLPTAQLFGDIKVGTLIIGEGALFKGNCEMRGEGVGANKK